MIGQSLNTGGEKKIKNQTKKNQKQKTILKVLIFFSSFLKKPSRGTG